jgi:hypothetical protein
MAAYRSLYSAQHDDSSDNNNHGDLRFGGAQSDPKCNGCSIRHRHGFFARIFRRSHDVQEIGKKH